MIFREKMFYYLAKPLGPRVKSNFGITFSSKTIYNRTLKLDVVV